MGIEALPLPGLYLLERTPQADARGWFERMYSAPELAGLLGSRAIAQVNRSLTSAKGTVRGLHYQVPPSSEAKLVSCLHGAILDVAVDLRRGSPTFLHWHAETLSEENRRSLFIPEGFAHGFQSLTDGCELLYLHTAPYDPAAERRVHPQDPRVAISWPLPVEHLSARDAAQPELAGDFEGVDA
jgi:dTDP-4-dehydrorhamnose 3,5-epimerase